MKTRKKIMNTPKNTEALPPTTGSVSSDVKTMGDVTISRNSYIENLEEERDKYRQALIGIMEAEDRYGHGANMCHPRVTMARAKARQILSENAQ